jgi:multiple sugar transport system permease protein
MALVNSFKVFDTIWVMTQGGPYRSSETLALTMYRETFVLSNFGVGSAFSVLLSVFILAISWGYLRSTLKEGS